jgi:hypothetical protein
MIFFPVLRVFQGGKGSSNFFIVDPGCVWLIVHQDALC